MRDRKKRNIIIGALCCLLVFMGIGYAILSQTLNISGIANMQGNWNVKITNMELLSDNKTGRAEEVSHSFTDTTATFTADLYMPGDSIEYRVTVENQGNIDAILKSITPTTTNKSEGIKFSHSEIDNTVLTAGKKITFTMKVEFLEDATFIPKVENVKYNLELVYVQYDGKSEYTPAAETTEDSCFIMGTAGEITGYDYNCGTVVTVPAEVDGIKVKSIAKGAFTNATSINIWIYSKEESADVTKTYYIFKDQNARVLFLETVGATQEELDAMAESENIYNYLKGDSALDGVDLGTLASSIFIYKNSDGEVIMDDGRSVPITELDLSNAEYLESIDLDAAPILKRLNLNTVNVLTFKSFDTEIELEELVINADVFSNTKQIQASSSSSVEVFNSAHIKKLIILDAKISNKLDISTDDNGLFRPDDTVVENVIIGDGIIELGTESLKNLGIKSITLPNTLTTIGNEAFAYNELTSLTIPASVETIGNEAVRNDNISSLAFASSSKLKTIGDRAFMYNKLISLTIPASVETIGEAAFWGTQTISGNQLTTINFEPNSKLKVIGHNAFSYNQLTSLTIPASVETIDVGTFRNNQITTINFESNSKLKTIGAAAFEYNKLVDLTIPSTVEIIDAQAFMNNKLTNLTIPASVETIGTYAFRDNQLTTINFKPDSKLKTIDTSAFKNNQLTNAGLGKLPSSLTNLSTTAFIDNSNLTQITLTSPTDISGWPNGGTVDGKTVTYER